MIKRTFCFLVSSELPASSPLVRLPFLFLDPEQKYVKYQETIFPKTIALPAKNCPLIQSLLYESQYKPFLRPNLEYFSSNKKTGIDSGINTESRNK